MTSVVSVTANGDVSGVAAFGRAQRRRPSSGAARPDGSVGPLLQPARFYGFQRWPRAAERRRPAAGCRHFVAAAAAGPTPARLHSWHLGRPAAAAAAVPWPRFGGAVCPACPAARLGMLLGCRSGRGSGSGGGAGP